MASLVLKFGRVETAALLSLGWALPMAVWAGSVDLEPGPLPWVAFGIGLVLLAGWGLLLPSIARLPQERRGGRFRLGQMSASEKRWNLLLAATLTLLIGWLNGAATVDWRILIRALGNGRPGPILLLAGIGLLAAVLLAGTFLAWRGGARAYRLRSQLRPEPGLTVIRS